MEKQPMKKPIAIRALTVAMILLIALTGCGGGGKVNTADAVATYESYAISKEDYDFFFRTHQLNYEYQARNTGFTDENMAEFWDSEENGQTYREAIKEMALQSAMQYTVLYTAASEFGSEATEEMNADTDAYVDSLPSVLNMEQAEFEKNFSITLDDMKAMYRKINAVEQYNMDLMESVELTEDEIKAAYEEDKEYYDQVTVRHVLISTQEMSEEEKKEAKAKAEDILKQIQDGEDIGKLAAEHSDDPGSASNNGEYTFPKGMMVAEFEDWAFAAKPGDQGMVETSYGFHVMEMIGHKEYEDVKAEVEENLRAMKADEKMSEVGAIGEPADWTVNEAILGEFVLP